MKKNHLKRLRNAKVGNYASFRCKDGKIRIGKIIGNNIEKQYMFIQVKYIRKDRQKLQSYSTYYYGVCDPDYQDILWVNSESNSRFPSNLWRDARLTMLEDIKTGKAVKKGNER